MSDNGQVKTLYSDESKQNAIYPRTVLSAVSGLQENLDLKSNISDIKDNLTSTDTNKPLSAKQGNVLKGYVGGLGNAIGTQGWNQLAQTDDVAASTDAGITSSITSGLLTITGTKTGPNRATIKTSPVKVIVGHKYLLGVLPKRKGASHDGTITFAISATGATIINYNTDKLKVNTFKGTVWTSTSTTVGLFTATVADCVFDIDLYRIIVDLTSLFGDGNEPSSVDDFRAMFPADFYPYYALNYIQDTYQKIDSQVTTIFVSASGTSTVTLAISPGIYMLGLSTGNANVWRYSGLIYRDRSSPSRNQLIQLDSIGLTVSLSTSTLTIVNKNTQYGVDITIYLRRI